MLDPLNCPYCDKKDFKHKGGLSGHIRFVHPDKYSEKKEVLAKRRRYTLKKTATQGKRLEFEGDTSTEPKEDSDVVIYRCGSCGSVIDEGNTFCPSCGLSLEWDKVKE